MTRINASRGLTLVEILTAMFVLAIGLGSVMAIVTRSASMGSYASDRNNAAVLLAEAISDVERYCLVTSKTMEDHKLILEANGVQEGDLMDTLGISNGSNRFSAVLFKVPQGPSAQSAVNPSFQWNQLAYKGSPGAVNQAYWPFSLKFSRVMGMFPPAASGARNSVADNQYDVTGPAYRALFKLEPHPEWFNPALTPNYINDSAFEGVYVLTIAMYRDLDPAKPVTSATPKRLEQLTDPVVVYLRDKRVRQ